MFNGVNKKKKKNIVIKGLNEKQDLGTVLRCYSLGSPFKILSCRFFLIRWKCIF